MKKGLYIILLVFFIPAISFAQSVVRGIVKDATGALPGVTVTEQGSKNLVLTDVNGKFSITLKGSKVLVFSSIGYSDQERKLNGGEDIEVILQPNSQDLNEVVVVGYGTTKKITNTGSVSSIKGAEIRNVPTASVQNALAGKLPGFVSVQRSGQPGRDASDFFIRGVSSLNSDGNQPLIIVDDIEYTYDQLSQINVNEIESISILKDASTTAVFGIKGANGVLVVKTRRGTSGIPKVNVRLESGVQSPVTRWDFLNAYESAVLYNEAVRGTTETPFSDADLEHFRTGDDPYGHPDVNWYEEIFKPSSMQYNSNVDLSGGSETIKYFISGGAFSQDGNLYDFENENNQVNSNYYYRRFNLRSNLDVQATKSLKLRLDLRANFAKINSPRAGNIVGEVFNFDKIRPWSAPFLNPDGSYAYASDTEELLPTINARLATSGYRLDRRNDMNILFGGTQDLNGITEGLSFSSRIAYASVEANAREQGRDNPPVYRYFPYTDTYQLKSGAPYVLENYTLRAYQGDYNSRVNFQANFNYTRTFGAHTINSLLLYNRESYKEKDIFWGGNWLPQNFQGVTFRTGYDYKQKFLIDVTAAYNGSDRFQADDRYGFFPAVSVGYNIAKEEFFQKKFEFVDLFKIRASYGLVGSDKVRGDRYLFQQIYNQGSDYSFGETHQSAPTIYEGNLGNDNVSWEKQNSFDVGLDLTLFNNKFSVVADYFNNERYDQLVVSQSLPLNIGVGVSPYNIARVRNKGFEFEIAYNNNIGEFNYNIRGVFSHFKNKILYQDEPTPLYPWLALTGHQIDQPIGYLFDGFYTEENIPDSPTPSGYQVQPGDLRYKDLNKDGTIDEYDRTIIGRPDVPNTSFGLTLGGGYKGFSFNVLFQGTTSYSFSIQGSGIEPLESQFQPIHQLRWTPETASSAKFPRLNGAINSPAAYMSDFWLIDATYLRLKTVEFGYQVPDKWLPFKISNARVYLSGYNLLTWTSYSLYQQDPEVSSNTAGDAYQNQRVVNLGLQIGL